MSSKIFQEELTETAYHPAGIEPITYLYYYKIDSTSNVTKTANAIVADFCFLFWFYPSGIFFTHVMIITV